VAGLGGVMSVELGFGGRGSVMVAAEVGGEGGELLVEGGFTGI
jgi:hypothetical protein